MHCILKAFFWLASLTAPFAAAVFAGDVPRPAPEIDHRTVELGGITRLDSTRKEIYLVFSGHEFADGGNVILRTLHKHGIRASFFFTGDFYRNKKYAPLIVALKKDGHYLGGHSDRHLLYATWEKRDSLLVSRETFLSDLRGNYGAMASFGITRDSARFFLPPFEWYNRQIAEWTKEAGLTLVNFTAGTYSNADWTFPGPDNKYLASDRIVELVLSYEAEHRSGLNGFLLLTHIGSDPRRKDKFYMKLDSLITELKKRGYSFGRL